jgi:hypothetical protein
MTRTVSLLSAATVAAFLAFGGAAAFAMATGPAGNGGHPGGGPNGPGYGGPALKTAPILGCEYRADQADLKGKARRAWRCQQSGEY